MRCISNSQMPVKTVKIIRIESFSLIYEISNGCIQIIFI